MTQLTENNSILNNSVENKNTELPSKWKIEKEVIWFAIGIIAAAAAYISLVLAFPAVMVQVTVGLAFIAAPVLFAFPCNSSNQVFIQ
jgi:hypothetical protein